MCAVSAFSLALMAAEPNLPKVEILGKEYYYYEIKKGESIYGIAKQFDWDVNELLKLNPNTALEMKKGSRLYYPTGKVIVGQPAEPVAQVDTDSGEEVDNLPSVSYEPITHLVKKGETVYSISKLYNIPLEVIYQNHPSAKKGIKAGETIVIRQDDTTAPSKVRYAYYNIKHGDTLYGLARQYKVTVADILKANPGVSETNFKAGDTVRIPLESTAPKQTYTEVVEENRLKTIDTYKVQKGDTWDTIAEKTGVDKEQLKEVNDESSAPKKNDVIAVPQVETVRVEREVEKEDPRELTAEGRQEIYDSINHKDSDVARLHEVRIALLLDDPLSKKDLEFSRGFLVALDEMKKSPYKIDFKILDGRAATNTVEDQLDEFEPQLIFTTADKNFPAFLADYGNTNHVEVVNAFDVKNDLYADNASIVQFLTPSSYFYQQAAEYVARNYKGYKFIFVGTPDAEDGIAEALMPELDGEAMETVSLDEFENYSFSDDTRYLIYAYPSKKDEVATLLGAVSLMSEKAPLSTATVVGRPNWITLDDTFAEKFAEVNVMVPSRFYYDQNNQDVKDFNEDFQKMFGHKPVRSYPTFAAVGYDMAHYFIPTVANSGGDFNRISVARHRPLQSDIDLRRVSNWGGFFNPCCYILVYRPFGEVEKIKLK